MKNNSIINCLECNNKCAINAFGNHLKIHKMNLKQYYDLYFKKLDEGNCLICKNETRFCGLKAGYKKTCSHKCANIFTNHQLFEKFGVTNQFQLQSIKDKTKATILKKYGTDNISKLDSIKKKKEETCFKNFGVKHPGNSSEILQKSKETSRKKYGTDNPMHNRKIAEKAVLNGGGRAKALKYKTKFGNEIIVQGSYEKLFVKFCEENNIFVEDGPFLYYIFEGKEHRYFIDFKIKINGKIKLVEIKSTYWYDQFREIIIEKNKAAEKFCKENDYEFCFIINDNNKKVLNLKKFEIILK